MSDESALAQEAGPEVVTDATQAEGQVQDQTAEAEPEGEAEEKKRTSAQERRDREKAYKQRLRDEAQAAMRKADEADARKRKIVEAGQSSREPTEQEFPDYVELAAAKAVWRQSRMMAERDAEQAGSEADAARREAEQIAAEESRIVSQQWGESVQEAKVRYADFEKVALDPSLPVSKVMAGMIQQSEVGPDVLYHLGQNRALAAQIFQMHPMEAARAIGRLEAAISAPKPRSTTTAPPPISPVKAGASAGLPTNPDKWSLADFRAAKERGLIR